MDISFIIFISMAMFAIGIIGVLQAQCPDFIFIHRTDA